MSADRKLRNTYLHFRSLVNILPADRVKQDMATASETMQKAHNEVTILTFITSRYFALLSYSPT